MSRLGRLWIYSAHRQKHTDRKATSHVLSRENVATTLQNFVYYDVLFSVYCRKHPPKFVSVLESYALTILFVHFLCLWRAVRVKLISNYIAFIDMIEPRKVCTCCVRHRAAKARCPQERQYVCDNLFLAFVTIALCCKVLRLVL